MKITFQPSGREVQPPQGATVLEAMRLAGLTPDAPCGGRGVCGKCRAALDGREVLTCRTAVDRDMTVTLPRSGPMDILTAGIAAAPRPDGTDRYTLALDVGTTTLAGYLLVRADPDTFGLLVPGDLAGGRGPGSTREELLHEELFAPWPGFVHAFVVFADSLFRHNAMVGLLCFGLGFALGVPTLILLLCNGLMLGAFLALHVERGLGVEFMAWLSIHGVTEILAVLLCAAAGLVVAEKIVFPGRLSRLENLARHGRAAASAAAGAVLLFFAAGILEGGFRQLIASTPGRFGVALLTGAWWLFYFSRCGRGGDDGKLR